MYNNNYLIIQLYIMYLTGGYTRIKTRGEKVISYSSSLKKRSSSKLKKGGKKQKTLKRRKQRKSRRKH